MNRARITQVASARPAPARIDQSDGSSSAAAIGVREVLDRGDADPDAEDQVGGTPRSDAHQHVVEDDGQHHEDRRDDPDRAPARTAAEELGGDGDDGTRDEERGIQHR